MKIREIKLLRENVQGLLTYCKENEIKNMHLNLGLLSNFEILSKEVTLIDKCIDPELIELEQKAQKLAEGKTDLILTLLSKDDLKKHSDLMVGYNELLNEERNISLEVIDKDKLIQVITIKEEKIIVPIEFGVSEVSVLKFFFDDKNWEKSKKKK